MIQTYFDKIEENITRNIASAKKRISVAVAWFTNQTLFNELIDALKRNVDVKVIVVNDLINRNEFGLDFGKLIEGGAEVKMTYSNKGTMHHKFCIIDNKVITGSYNWTYHANINNENVVVIDEPNIVKSYCEQFDAIFNTGKLIELPYKQLKWTDVNEGDFSELGRNILKDIIAKNDENSDLKKTKLISLNNAYKNGNPEELEKASSLPTAQNLRTIIDVLTSPIGYHDFKLQLWEENLIGRSFDDVVGHKSLCRWFFIPPHSLTKNRSLEGKLVTESTRNDRIQSKLKLHIYDKEYVSTILDYSLNLTNNEYIPDEILCINKAKMFYFSFPSPMFNKNKPSRWGNGLPRLIHGIDLLGLVKEIHDDKIIFYEGWDPNERGKIIQETFFTQNL